ncbi:hypothetical protein NCU05572 [Neurospora crassa OR74A]|uniref:Uncharacterized protein n=1 Tax=Neurospora crassa (strain ATCC 24698 / 74-OR23-1A / CBS 708.71 / DSM 1257 / FGSC 987) TaxID=367110 RepID=Q7S6Z1_NEUCR|nr:hypothetical protein NCU05572 [Neurospora crassa OR74A]EAA31298.1 hypothetical protein NCU05572 [Neurospora crassa OR74A]|eukprot:XP_960534.1 hypothetical protein NCU05572 [Neurospora crassa OR74A]
MQSTNSSSSSKSSMDSPLEVPLLPHERLQPPSSAHLTPLRTARHLPLDSDNSSDSKSSGSFPFPDMKQSDRPSSSSYDSNETISIPLLPHEQLTSPWASMSSMGSPSSSSTSTTKRTQMRKNKHHRPNPLILERMQHAQHAPMLEPETQYEQGSWFPPSSSSTSSAPSYSPTGTTTTILPPDHQRHRGEFCASPEPMTPVEDQVRRSLRPLFDMEIFGNKASDQGFGACANNESETDIIANLEEGYLPPALETRTHDEEECTMKRSESLVSFKDLHIPEPKAPASMAITTLKRRVSYACETATELVKGSRAAATTSAFVGDVFEYLIKKGF